MVAEETRLLTTEGCLGTGVEEIKPVATTSRKTARVQLENLEG
jgi:hypothetical protein